MNKYRGVLPAIFIASLVFCDLAHAEDPPSIANDTAADGRSGTQTLASPGPMSDGGWHTNATFYLWMPGVHGDLAAGGYRLGFRASPGDLLSHVDFGLMGLVGVQHNRLVILTDVVWTPLSISKTYVFDRLPTAPQLSADVKYTQFFLTPFIGYRVLNHPRLHIDGLAGFRYWHQGTTLRTAFAGERIQSGSRYSTSKDWADPLLGTRVLFPLTPKLAATVFADVGGWGAGSQLDYQWIGALTYKLKPKWGLNAGWRYLYIDYASKAINTLTVQSGIVFGVTYSINPPE